MTGARASGGQAALNGVGGPPAYAVVTSAWVQGGELNYTAAPGQVNHVVFTRTDPNTYLVDDLVAITPLEGCGTDTAGPGTGVFSGRVGVGGLDQPPGGAW